jgi:secreted Zn-dependent insulinase-like peptidase
VCSLNSGLGWIWKLILENLCIYYIQVQEVVGLLYEYIKMLRKIGPQEWVFKELQDMTNMEFRFVEDDHADEYAVNLSSKN